MSQSIREDNFTEFKSSFSDSAIESLVAFANAKGGRVIIGINDKGIPVKGFSVGAESLQKWINEVKNKTQPSIIPDAELIKLEGQDVDCLIHRNYLSPIDVQICLFDNYVEFYNPGLLSGNLTVEDLKRDDYKAHARNKLIAEAFYLTGDIEKYGSGFLRIRKEISTYPTMKLEFREGPNGFLNKLSYRDQKIFTKPVDEGLNEGLKSLLEMIARYPGIQAKDLPGFLNNRPLKTIERQIKQLVDKELIERYGSRKTGGYFVIESNLAE